MAPIRCALALALLGIVCTACSHLDLSTAPLGDQVVRGTVDFHPVAPYGKVSVLVRMVDVTHSDSVVIGEQTIDTTEKPPVAFKITYTADQIEPPKRVQLDVRVSVDGKLRYYNINSYAVTPMNADREIHIWVEPIGR